MTGLIIKDGDSIQTPRGEAFVLEQVSCVLEPYGLAESFRNLLFLVRLRHSPWNSTDG